MQYIVVEQWNSIEPVIALDEQRNAVFDSYDEALELKEKVQDGYVFPLTDIFSTLKEVSILFKAITLPDSPAYGCVERINNIIGVENEEI